MVVFQSVSQYFSLKWTDMEMSFKPNSVFFHMELKVVFIRSRSMDRDYWCS